jgi:hypothetical protein
MRAFGLNGINGKANDSLAFLHHMPMPAQGRMQIFTLGSIISTT